MIKHGKFLFFRGNLIQKLRRYNFETERWKLLTPLVWKTVKFVVWDRVTGKFLNCSVFNLYAVCCYRPLLYSPKGEHTVAALSVHPSVRPHLRRSVHLHNSRTKLDKTSYVNFSGYYVIFQDFQFDALSCKKGFLANFQFLQISHSVHINIH